MKNKINYNDLRDSIFSKINSINTGEEFSIKDLIDLEIWQNISDEEKESIGKLFYAELLRTKNKSITLNNNYVGTDYGIKNVYIKNNINTTSNSKKAPIKLIVGIIVMFVLVVVFAVIISLNSEPKLTHTEEETGRLYAIRDISKNDDYIKSSLGCKTDSKTSDGIILVQCTDYGNNIKVQYGSNEVWYGYITSDDGMYTYYVHKDKDMVLSYLRK